MSNESMTVKIRQLSLRCVVGVFHHERKRKQRLRLVIKLGYKDVPQWDHMQAGIVDYLSIYRLVRQVIRDGEFLTLEALSRAVAQSILDYTPCAARVWVNVEKPRALPGTTIASVEYYRER